VRSKTINETITVDREGNASCEQVIEYLNNGSQALSFKGLSKTLFDKNCENFSLKSKPPALITPLLAFIEDQPYQKMLAYEQQGSIASGKKAKIILEYTWKDFRNKAGFKRISTQFDTLTTNYTLIIKVDDDTFTDHLIAVYDGDNVLNRGEHYLVTIEGHLHITRQNLSRNSKMDIRIKAEIRKIDLPVVRDIAEEPSNCFKKQYVVLTILHLLRDALPFFQGLISMGVDKDDIFILGIPYSSKDDVIEQLRAWGCQVHKANLADYFDDFRNQVKYILKDALDQCTLSGKQLLIIEDGGYAVPILHTEFALKLNLCFGAVEQTANGIWVDKELDASGKLKIPIMNVAECDLKKDRESPLVGEAIIKNIDRLLDGYGTRLKKQKVGQMGFGNIGKEAALRMKHDAIDLTIFDDDPKIQKDALNAGFKVADSLESLFDNKTLIIGCTGKEIVGLDELRNMNRNVFFVNATSKLRELKYLEFRNSTYRINKVRGIGAEYQLKGGKQITIRLLADGFPVNFFESSESIPDKEIQFIPALLLAAAAYLDQVNNKPGIIGIPDSIQDNIKRLMDLHDESK
jgi:S-adenosylhomocysteine hydrolase